jgi:hypothetical protein
LSAADERLVHDVKRELTISGPTARRLCHAAGLTLGAVLVGYRRRKGRAVLASRGFDPVRFRLYAIVSQIKFMSIID